MKSYVYPTATATAHALIEHLVAMMEREPEKTFHFAFSGGSTPSLMFDIWANEYKKVTPWMRMRIYWVDERCVPAEDYESNYGTMRRLLLDEVGIPDEYVYPIDGVNRPEDEAKRYSEQVYRTVPLSGGFRLSMWSCLVQAMTGILPPFFPVRNICSLPFILMK